MPRAQPEQELQRAVAQFLDRALPGPPECIWTAIGHGGGGQTRGAILKAMGLKAGWPDVLIIIRRCVGIDDMTSEAIYSSQVIGIELKTRRGRQSDDQQYIEARFDDMAMPYHVCRSVEEVEAVLSRYVRLRARIAA